MYKLPIILLFLSNSLLGQEYLLNKKVDSIPLLSNNKYFRTLVNKEYNKLIRVKADSILLYYKLSFESNYCVIFFKRGGTSKCFALYQYNPPKQIVGKEFLKNSVLENINMKYVWSIFQPAKVRAIDTTGFTSEVYPIYCQVYFGDKKELNAGYSGPITLMLGDDFYHAYAAEMNRILDREFKKSGVRQMQF